MPADQRRTCVKPGQAGDLVQCRFWHQADGRRRSGPKRRRPEVTAPCWLPRVRRRLAGMMPGETATDTPEILPKLPSNYGAGRKRTTEATHPGLC